LDFGAAKRLDGGADDDGTPRRTFVGTPEYAPPDQWTGGVVAASDRYSLGGTLFYMVTGRFPYQKGRRDPPAYRASPSASPGAGGLDVEARAQDPRQRRAQHDLSLRGFAVGDARTDLHPGSLPPAARLRGADRRTARLTRPATSGVGHPHCSPRPHDLRVIFV